MTKIILDLNEPEFQNEFFELQKDEQLSLLNTLKKIAKQSWEQLYKDSGINWESISQKSKKGDNIYSFRFSKKYRGTARRENNFMVLVGLFTDHDSARQRL